MEDENYQPEDFNFGGVGSTDFGGGNQTAMFNHFFNIPTGIPTPQDKWWVFMYIHTPPKSNIDTKNDGLEYASSFKHGVILGINSLDFTGVPGQIIATKPQGFPPKMPLIQV